MTNRTWVKWLILGVVLVCSGCAPPTDTGSPTPEPTAEAQRVVTEHPHPEWTRIHVYATWDNGTITVDDQKGAHDTALVGPGDTLSWNLHCTGCPDGTTYHVTQIQRVASMNQLAEAAMAVFRDPDPDRTVGREELGIAELGELVGEDELASAEPGTLDPGGETASPFSITIGNWFEPGGGELWKYTVEVCDPEGSCDGLDPHTWGHSDT